MTYKTEYPQRLARDASALGIRKEFEDKRVVTAEGAMPCMTDGTRRFPTRSDGYERGMVSGHVKTICTLSKK